MSDSASLQLDMGSLRVNTKALGPKLNRGISALMLSNAPKVQDYARSNAKWTDRTGNARQGLFAKYSGEGGVHQIDLYHTVPYGIWLEVRWAGKYAVIAPTVNVEGQRIMAQMQGLLSRLEGAV
jgi:hypothetical protein